jgi:hypothetical protein
MSFSTLDRLIFVGSFMVLMNWGTRLTFAILENAFS